jgi:serine/threonine protein kinase
VSSLQPVEFGKYLLLDRIAIGGMAEVYRAKLIGEEGFEKPVVLKKMLPHLTAEEEMVSGFIDEARLSTFLKHENIIDIYDFGNVSDTFYIAMEYLFGKDLHQIISKALEKNNPVDLENILYILLNVCEGLEYAHQLKDFEGNQLSIIHRDISPQNIFITYEGQVKLLDFGIAKAASKSTKTQTGILKGKAAYMSPEQAEGKPIDHRSDIFALGIILYELVTQKKMFEGDTFQVLSQVIQARYEPPENIKPDLPDNLCRIIHKSLQKNPADRYQSCREMAEDLEQMSDELIYRLSTKKMAIYIQSLFKGHFDMEKQQMAEAMTCGKRSSQESKSEGEKSEESEYPEYNKPYQQTEAISKNHVAAVDALKEGFRNLKAKAKDTFDMIRSFRIPDGKPISDFVIVVMLMIFGITTAYLIRPDDMGTMKIQNLIEAAEISMEDNRIISPKKDCSLHYYQEVLKLDSQSKAAKKGLKKVVSKCVRYAEKEIKNSNLRGARKYVYAGLRIDPENQRLLEIKTKVAIGPALFLDTLRNALNPPSD